MRNVIIGTFTTAVVATALAFGSPARAQVPQTESVTAATPVAVVAVQADRAVHADSIEIVTVPTRTVHTVTVTNITANVEARTIGHAPRVGWRCWATIAALGVGAVASIILFLVGSPYMVPVLMSVTGMAEYKAARLFSACR